MNPERRTANHQAGTRPAHTGDRGPTRALLVPVLGLVLLLAGPLIAPAQGQQSLVEIAAVVNDTVISTRDVQARLRLAILASGLSDTPETRERLRPQVMQELIDEALQRQAAERAGVSIGDEAAEQRFARLAEQNGMSPEAFAEALRSGNVDPAELRDRLKAQLLWQRYVSQRLQQRLQITEEQVNEYLEELEENRGEPEYRVAEIFLAAEDGEARRDARGLARRLTTELRQGAEFAALARQFSDSAGGQGGGEMGWVQPGQLDPALEEALRGLSVGGVSDPIAAGGGVHILKLLDRRRILTADPAEIQVSLKQLVLSPSAPPAEEVRARIESCTQMDQVIERFGQPGSGNLGTLTLGDVPADLREALLEVQDGEVSRAIEWRGEPTLFMVCERNSPDVSLPSREEVRNRLANQRFTLLSRRLMRDLRESAYVEVRTG